MDKLKDLANQLGPLLDDKIKKIVEKGMDMSHVDLYNLCLLNKLKDAKEVGNGFRKGIGSRA